MSSFVFREARILDPAHQRDGTFDLWIEEGFVRGIEKPGQIPKPTHGEEFFLKGKWITPGFIDLHTHLREPGLEHKETIATGTHAAVAGGFTSVACMANTLPINDSAWVTAFIREQAKNQGHCRVFPVGAVSKGLRGEELAELGLMAKAGAIAFSDDGMPVMNSELMRRALEYSKAFDLPIIDHAEDLHLVAGGVMNEGALATRLGLRGNPAAAEEIMVTRDIALVRLTRGRLHLAHISSQLSLEAIRRAKEEDLRISAEVTPHHLCLTENQTQYYDTHCKMAPPLRAEQDRKALVDALSRGIIDCIATDHAPHSSLEKNLPFDQAAHGIIGLQTAISQTLELVRKNELKPLRWVESLTHRPAQILKLPYGHLGVGATADLVVLDPEMSWTYEAATQFSKSQNSPLLGKSLKGKILSTWLQGKRVYESR